MRRALLLASMLIVASLVTPLHAADANDGEQHFLASLQLGASPNVCYLDAAGKPLSYDAFAQQLGDGKNYSSTRDTQAGTAVLRIAGSAPGHRGVRLAFGRGDAFPPFELPAIQGGTQRLSAFHGRYTLVSFFFAECGPCIAEVPALNAYARAHGDMNFVAITYEDASTARQFATQRGFTWPILHDGQALIDVLGISTYPTLMLIDPEGHLAGTAIGMTLRQDDAQRQADLERWIALWKSGRAN
ncbi:TlpA family protein disulfide reductase [Dyella sp. 20L07]|uniref:TlpA family protein disulfide reductase n=1 Tax=Dyella sp. 20L07 TaxID=3384240 RepID=UPI003D2697EB